MNSITHMMSSDHKRIGVGKVYEVFLGKNVMKIFFNVECRLSVTFAFHNPRDE